MACVNTSTSLSHVHKAALRACRVRLEDDLDIDDIWAQCIQDGIIPETSQEKVQGRKIRREKCRLFLDILEGRDMKAFDDFICALNQNYPFLTELLETEIRNQSLLLAISCLTIANKAIPNKLKPGEEHAVRVSVRNVLALGHQLQSSLGVSTSVSLDTSISHSLVDQFQDLNLTKSNLTEKQSKIGIPAACLGMCLSPLGETVLSINKQGIMVYNPDFTLKLKFTVDKPDCVVCLPTGEIIVSSRTNNCVKQYNSNGDYQSDICKQVNKPLGLAFNNNVGLIVIGGGPQTINICTVNGEIKHTITNESFKFLFRVHVNPYNLNILVSDLTTNTLYCFTEDGGQVFKYTGHRDDQLNGPRGIFVTKQHILLVDHSSHRVVLLNHQGGYIKTLFTKAQHGIEYPGEVLVDSAGNILVGKSSTGSNFLHVFKVSE